jgi:hypothetical protein
MGAWVDEERNLFSALLMLAVDIVQTTGYLGKSVLHEYSTYKVVTHYTKALWAPLIS